MSPGNNEHCNASSGGHLPCCINPYKLVGTGEGQFRSTLTNSVQAEESGRTPLCTKVCSSADTGTLRIWPGSWWTTPCGVPQAGVPATDTTYGKRTLKSQTGPRHGHERCFLPSPDHRPNSQEAFLHCEDAEGCGRPHGDTFRKLACLLLRS